MLRSRTAQIFDHLGWMARRLVGDIKAGLDALHRVQFDEPWTRATRPTYEEWQAYIAPRPRAPRPQHPSARTLVAKPASR